MLKFSNSFLFLFCAGLFLFSTSDIQAQTIKGKVLGPENQVLAYTIVDLLTLPDSSVARGVRTDSAGNYQFKELDPGAYLIVVQSMSYETVSVKVQLDSFKNINQNIVLTTKVNVFKGSGVTVVRDPVKQKNDTLEFNAGNYKVNQDATAENLITKMPGITNENGTIKAQGEEVKKVTVDGQDFYGDDAAAALKNLPAEVIDKIQVFDRQSDQSQFTGIDDGNSQKTLNIVTKAGKNNGQFGKIYGGYGTEDRWAAGANVNIFKGKQRLSLIGMSNNINQQNFSSQDILGLTGNSQSGGMSRGGRPGGPRGMGGDAGSFMVNQQGGINTTNALGLNYSYFGGKKLKFTAAYFFNNSANVNASFLNRTYFLSSLNNQNYTQGDTGKSRSTSHRLNARLEYNLDSNNSLIFTPNIKIQNSKSNSSFLGQTNSETLLSLINSSMSSTESSNMGYELSQNLLLRHRFKKPGQTVSLNINTSLNNNNGESRLNSGNSYYEPVYFNDEFSQNTESKSKTFSISPNLSYTHPIRKKSMVEVNYNPSFNRNTSDKYTARLDSSENTYTLTDSLLSNKFDNRINTQRVGLTYRYTATKLSFNVGANLQSVELIGTQLFPNDTTIRKTFNNILPNARLTYNRNKNSNLRIFYRSNTELPTVNQLQNVVNNSNPLILSAGNAELRQEFRHNIFTRYSSSNPVKSSTFFLYAGVTTAADYIGNSTIVANNDTTINGNIELRKGAQISMPVNLDGYRSFRSFASYGIAVKKIKSTVNLTLGQNISRSPALINGQTNYSNSYITNGGIVIASNISERIDFTINYNGSYNQVVNSLQSDLNNSYFIRNFNFKGNFMPNKHFVFNTDITNSSYTGLGESFNQSIWLCNAGLGYKFMKDQRAELKLSVFDALGQNTSINRTVTESYIEDKNTQILTRFYMLTFTYSIRHFNAKPKAPAAKK